MGDETHELFAVMLREGDRFLWLSPEADDVALVAVTVRKVHYGDPVAGKLRLETDIGDIPMSARERVTRFKTEGRNRK